MFYGEYTNIVPIPHVISSTRTKRLFERMKICQYYWGEMYVDSPSGTCIVYIDIRNTEEAV